MKNSRVKKSRFDRYIFGALIALELLMSFTFLGYVQIPPVSFTTAYIPILMGGELFSESFKERNLAPQNLSRTLEDAGTCSIPLVPWSAGGAYMSGTLGVSTFAYAPWAIFCYAGFCFAVLWGFTGFGIKKLNKDK